MLFHKYLHINSTVSSKTYIKHANQINFIWAVIIISHLTSQFNVWVRCVKEIGCALSLCCRFENLFYITRLLYYLIRDENVLFIITFFSFKTQLLQLFWFEVFFFVFLGMVALHTGYFIADKICDNSGFLIRASF